mmetsp:Transcript_415/g.812  ORF Transcript_415/g.812 Transcript_415/m.812 type:complete len:162 (+) Transcript_415:140-625(+)
MSPMDSPAFSIGVRSSPKRRRRESACVAHIALSVLIIFSLVNHTHGFSVGTKERAAACHTNHQSPLVVPFSDPAGITLIDSTIYQSNPSSALWAKKQPDDAQDEDSGSGFVGIFKKSPGVAIVAPFVLLFGLDLILNIAVITKRSLEVFFTGEYTVWTPWQ